MSKLKVRRFEPRSIKLGSTVLLIGRRGSGKSCLMKDICYHLYRTGKIDLAIAMSPTEIANNSLSTFVLPSLIYTDWREDVCEKLVEVQRKQCRMGRAKNVVLILDDIAFNGRKVFNSRVLRNLYMNGRHYKITTILLIQYAMDLPPCIRNNIDITIAHRDPIHKSRQILYENYFGMFSSYTDFNRTMNALTEDWGVIVCQNNCSKQSNLITDSVFHYKASLRHPPFKLCSPIYMRLHSRYFRPDLEFSDSRTKITSSVEVPLRDREIVKAGSDGRTVMTGRTRGSTALIPWRR